MPARVLTGLRRRHEDLLTDPRPGTPSGCLRKDTWVSPREIEDGGVPSIFSWRWRDLWRNLLRLSRPRSTPPVACDDQARCGSRSIARLHGPGTSGTPAGRSCRKLLNTDAHVHGGSNVGNAGGVTAEARPWTGQRWSVTLTLPPLGVLVLKPGAA